MLDEDHFGKRQLGEKLGPSGLGDDDDDFEVIEDHGE